MVITFVYIQNILVLYTHTHTHIYKYSTRWLKFLAAKLNYIKKLIFNVCKGTDSILSYTPPPQKKSICVLYIGIIPNDLMVQPPHIYMYKCAHVCMYVYIYVYVRMYLHLQAQHL